MTFGEEFVPDEGQEFGEEADYPTVFGITFTPKVSSIMLGLVGILGAGYIYFTWIQPAQKSYQELKADRETKEAQVQRQQTGEIERKIDNLEGELQRSQALKSQALALFSSEQSLDTLLLDINRFIAPSQATLISFKPQGGQATIVSDNSLGTAANNKLKRKSINVEMEGSFQETQSILRDLERLQPLLMVKNLRSQVNEQPSLLFKQGKVVPQGSTKLKTSFRVDVLLPLNEKELAKVTPPAEQQAQ